MGLRVVGAGVGRTGTHSLKLALEQLLGTPCHHMMEMFPDPAQQAAWIDAVDGKPVDWHAMLARYGAQVDWPGASFWPELVAAFPDALVLLSVRDPEEWYISASNTIFNAFDKMPPEIQPWMSAVRQLLHDRFCDRFDDPTAMTGAFVRHNDAVRAAIPVERLLEWSPSDGWEPICERLGVALPSGPFPLTNTTDEFRSMIGMPALS
jgi:hypothetical protein